MELLRPLARLYDRDALDRTRAVARMERIAAVTHLVSSLEYLARDRDRRKGGMNNWDVTGRTFRARAPRLAPVLDAIADRRVTAAVHVARALTAATLVSPFGGRRARLAADAALSASSAALYPRHHYGTDGSDQVAFLVQTMAAVARSAHRRPEVVDACLWYVALQSALSYGVSGWVKLAGPSWRGGQALPGVMRTLTYGDAFAWRTFTRFPRVARALGASVLAMECTFPLVFAGRGRLAAPMLASATLFHVANARLMGLGRFVWSFTAMHPAVLYASGPAERTDARGRTMDRRDDTLPAVCGALIAAALALALAAQARRHRVVLRGHGDEETLTTSGGDVLAFRRTGPPADGRPVVVLEAALLSTAEHWAWTARALAERHPTVTYARAGYGPSRRAATEGSSLDAAVRNLAELAEHVGGGRPVVLVGHSLGGWLALRAAAQRPELVQAVALVDSSHPAELQRSSRQAQGQEALTGSLALMPVSLRLGLGMLLKRPDWVDALPEDVRELALAQYRDPRLWAAGSREWRDTVDEFGSFDGRLPRLDVPVLVLTAGQTARNDPVQDELHAELAAVSPRGERHLVDGADHDQVLTHPVAARRVAERIVTFIAAAQWPAGDREVERDGEPAR